MAVDFREVLQELMMRQATLAKELEVVQNAMPAIRQMIKAQDAEAALKQPKGKYSGWGATRAIQDVLSCGEPLTRDEIYSRLTSEGWTTESKDALSSVSATLSQLKAVVENVEGRWRLRGGERTPTPRATFTLAEISNELQRPS